MITSWSGSWKVTIFSNVDVDPQNKGFLTYDEFYKNISKAVKLSHPEAYVVYKQCLDQQKNLLSMKSLFKTLGGSWLDFVNQLWYKIISIIIDLP